MRWYSVIGGVGLMVALGCLRAGAADEKAGSVAVPKLPTFTKGKYKGKHAVYRAPTFEAAMDAAGSLWVQPRDNDGKPVGKAFVCYQVHAYYVSTGGRQHARKIAGFDSPPEPCKQPDKIHLKGKLIEDIPFEVMYEFRGNTITASGGCADVPGLESPTSFRLLSRFPRSHKIANNVEQDEREELLKDCILITKETPKNGRRKTYRYPYYETMRFAGVMDSAQVKGPYGQRMIELKPKSGNEGRLCGYVYSDFCPWEGYVIQYITQGSKINLRKYRATVTVLERGGATRRRR